MKIPFKYLSLFSLITAVTVSVHAADETVSGKLTVTGDTEAQGGLAVVGDSYLAGNNLTMGTESGSYGLGVFYYDSGTEAIELEVKRAADWLWQLNLSSSITEQMRLDASNNLILYSGGTAGVTLNPATKTLSLGDATLYRESTGVLKTDGAMVVAGAFDALSYNATSGVIEGGASGLELKAGGTDQNVVITPSGTGNTILSGNVGIGTATPNAALHINGASSNFEALRLQTSMGNANDEVKLVFSAENNNVDAMIGAQRDGSSTAGILKFYTSKTANTPIERLRISSNGYVGIGTSTPESLMHLAGVGDARITIEADTDNIGENDNPSLLLRQDGNLTGGLIGLSGDSNYLFSGANPNSVFIEVKGLHGGNHSALQFVTGGTTIGGTDGTARMTITSDGNVGIGTTNPVAAQLVVVKEQTTPSNTVIAEFTKTGANTYGSSILRLSRGAGNQSMDLEFNSGGGSPFRHGSTYYDSLLVNNQNSTAGPFGSIHFVTNSSSRLTVGGGTLAGNVGIGTTSPTEALDVVGNGKFTGTITASNISGTNTGDQSLASLGLDSGDTVSFGQQALSSTVDSTSATTGALTAHSAGFADDVFIGDNLTVTDVFSLDNQMHIRNTFSNGELKIEQSDGTNGAFLAISRDVTDPFFQFDFTTATNGVGIASFGKSSAPMKGDLNDVAVVEIAPTYNQTTGNHDLTDLLINRTETSIGTGQQHLIDAQVGGSSKFSVDNKGVVRAEQLSLTATAVSGTREYLERHYVSDQANSEVGFVNGTIGNGNFSPTVYGFNSDDNTYGLMLTGIIQESHDSGANDAPVVRFNAFAATDVNDPMNSLTSVDVRPLFGWFTTSGLMHMKMAATGALELSSNVASSSPTTGALTVAGGVGVGGDLNVGGAITATNITGTNTGDQTLASLGLDAGSAVNFGQQNLSANVDSTSATTGALTAHSAGFADDLFVGDSVKFNANDADDWIHMDAGWINVYKSGENYNVLSSRMFDDTTHMFRLETDGTMEWGDGTNAADTTLYRSGPNSLRTDDSFVVGGSIKAAPASGTAHVRLDGVSGANGSVTFLEDGVQVFKMGYHNADDAFKIITDVGSYSHNDFVFNSSGFSIGASTDSSSSTTGALTAHSAGFADDVYVGDLVVADNVYARSTGNAVSSGAGGAAFQAQGAQDQTSALILRQSNVVNWRVENQATTGDFRIHDGVNAFFDYDKSAQTLALSDNVTVQGSITATNISGSNTGDQTAADLGLGSSDIVNFGYVGVSDGSAASPSISFSTDSGSGMFSTAINQLSIATGGHKRWTFSGNELVGNGSSGITLGGGGLGSTTGVINTADRVYISSNASSLGPSTGALTVAGGVGIGESLHVEDTVNIGADIRLGRHGSSDLSANSRLRVERAASGNGILAGLAVGDSVERFNISAQGYLTWGSGMSSRDTNLYRKSANVLRTDDGLEIGGEFSAANSNFVVEATGHTFAKGSVGTGINLYLEGATDDAFEAKITTVDPTGSDKIHTLPDKSGTFAHVSDLPSLATLGLDTTDSVFFADVTTTNGLSVQNSADAQITITADSDNSGENDNPSLLLQQDGNGINGLVGLTGDPDHLFSGATYNSTFIEAKGGSDPGFGAIQFVTGGTPAGGTDGTARMTITSDGNVGIGAIDPDARIVVAADVTSGTNEVIGEFGKNGGHSSQTFGSSILRVSRGVGVESQSVDFEYNSGGSGPFRYGSHADALVVNNTATLGDIHFVTNDAIRLSVGGGVNAGNIGIGTEYPTVPLDVAGNGKFTGTITASNFTGSSSGTNTGDQTFTLTGDVTGSGTGSFTTTIDASIARDTEVTAAVAAHATNTSNPHAVTAAQVGLGNVDNTSDANKPVSAATQIAIDAKQPLDADLTAIAALNTTAAGRSLLDDADAASQRTTLGLGASDTVTFENVGLGTSAPSAQLHLSDTPYVPGGGPTFKLSNTHGDAFSVTALNNSSPGGWDGLGLGGSVFALMKPVDTYAGVIGTDTDSRLVFATNSTQKMTILSSGDVGIGTTEPQAKLDVTGEIRITGTGNSVVKGPLLLVPQGDLDMGGFTAGTDPSTL